MNNETVEQVEEDIRKNIKQAELDAEDECIECVYTVFEVENMIDRIIAAHKRELAAKDAEIASLRALVKESIELLKKVNDVEFVDVTAWFDGCVDAEQQEWLDSAIAAIHKCQLAFDGIIAKAREVCK